MRNKEQWTASKYVFKEGKLSSSKDPHEVGIGSRLVADLIADVYAAYIPQYVRGKLIDLGCGKVPLFEAYRNYCTDVVCVDWGNTSHENNYLDFECDLTQKLPFQDNEFETIIVSDVLEHISEPGKLWKEMHRILAPGGRLLLSAPFFYGLHEEPYDYYRYTEHALRRFARQSNFEVLLLQSVGGTPEIAVDIIAKHLQCIPIVGPVTAAFIQRVAFVFGRTAVWKKLSDRTSKKFPLCYFLIAEKK